MQQYHAHYLYISNCISSVAAHMQCKVTAAAANVEGSKKSQPLIELILSELYF